MPRRPSPELALQMLITNKSLLVGPLLPCVQSDSVKAVADTCSCLSSCGSIFSQNTFDVDEDRYHQKVQQALSVDLYDLGRSWPPWCSYK